MKFRVLECMNHCKGCTDLSKLPKVLPEGLQGLYCRESLISELPKLPKGLQELDCHSCPDLSKLPKVLPEGLQILDCHRCLDLSKLPEVLPKGLQILNCSECPISELPEVLLLMGVKSKELLRKFYQK